MAKRKRFKCAAPNCRNNVKGMTMYCPEHAATWLRRDALDRRLPGSWEQGKRA